MGFTCVAMLDAIHVTNAFKCANHASKALGWFGVDLVVNSLLAPPSAFWLLLELRDFPIFLV
jgi:hypothetical protein